MSLLLVFSALWMALFSSVLSLLLILAGATELLAETRLKRCACFGESFSRILIICSSVQQTYHSTYLVPINPLIATLKTQSNRPSYSNTVIDGLAVDGWAVAFGTARRGVDGPTAHPGPSSLYQM